MAEKLGAYSGFLDKVYFKIPQILLAIYINFRKNSSINIRTSLFNISRDLIRI